MEKIKFNSYWNLSTKKFDDFHEFQVKALQKLRNIDHRIKNLENKRDDPNIDDNIPNEQPSTPKPDITNKLATIKESKETETDDSASKELENEKKKRDLMDLTEQRKAQAEILSREEANLRKQQDAPLWPFIVVISILHNMITIPFRLAFWTSFTSLQVIMDFLLKNFFLITDFITYIIFALDIFIVRKQKIHLQEAQIKEKMIKKLLSVHEKVEIKRLFDSFDVDGNGHISITELCEAMKSIGESHDEKSLMKLMQEFDLDQNGTIEFAEFSMVLEHIQAKKAIGDSSDEFGLSLRYFLDILSSIPFNIFGIYYFGYSNSQFLLIIQIFKVSRLYFLLYTIEKNWRFLNPSIFRLLHLIFISFLISHWVGCAWFIIGKIEGFGTNVWVPSASVYEMTMTAIYIRVFYWGFINTTGIDNQKPFTSIEICFSMIVMFIGVSMYATIIGNVGSLLSNLDSTAVSFREKIETVSTYMHYKKIPSSLQARVIDYYEYLWSRQKGLDETRILKDLPSSMQTDIALFLNREVLEKVPFLKSASDNFINVLVRMLKPQVCSPGEFIIRHGDIGREMYFINRGVVVVCSDDGTQIFSVLSDGSFFGEYALLFSQKRTASVKSTTYCDLFVLTQEDFQSVLDDFPEFARTMRREGVKRVVERIPIFADLSQELKDAIVSLLKPMTYNKSEIIVKKGDIGKEMYFISQGGAQVEDGKTILSVLQEGDFFGELALLSSSPRTATVRATKHCDIFILTRKDFASVLRISPKFAKRIKDMEKSYQNLGNEK